MGTQDWATATKPVGLSAHKKRNSTSKLAASGGSSTGLAAKMNRKIMTRSASRNAVGSLQKQLSLGNLTASSSNGKLSGRTPSNEALKKALSKTRLNYVSSHQDSSSRQAMGMDVALKVLAKLNGGTQTSQPHDIRTLPSTNVRTKSTYMDFANLDDDDDNDEEDDVFDDDMNFGSGQKNAVWGSRPAGRPAPSSQRQLLSTLLDKSSSSSSNNNNNNNNKSQFRSRNESVSTLCNLASMKLQSSNNLMTANKSKATPTNSSSSFQFGLPERKKQSSKYRLPEFHDDEEDLMNFAGPGNLQGDALSRLIEIRPGVQAKLKGAYETWSSVQREFYLACCCGVCRAELCCIRTVGYVLCPHCQVITSTETAAAAAHETMRDPSSVGVGLTLEDLRDWRQRQATTAHGM